MNSFLQFAHAISAFYREHEGVCNLLGVSAIMNMPPARNVLYKWVRDTLQSFVGALKPHPETPNPTLPATPANPKD